MARQLGIQFVEDRLQRRSNGSWREGEARDTSSGPANYILAVMYSPQYNGHAGDRGYRVNPRVN